MTVPTTTTAAGGADALTGFTLDAGSLPDARGRFGAFGGAFVPEVLVPAVERVADAYAALRRDPAFAGEFVRLCRSFIGRPTPLHHAQRLSVDVGGAQIFLKREDLAHTGAHKLNNALGQALLARSLGVRKVIAETGAGQHGVATATACALLDMECTVYMGEVDMTRQHPNVLRMELLGATVRPVREGSRTLKDAINAAIRDWVERPDEIYYLIGSAVGMHPYPLMVRDFQSVIGHEARAQIVEQTGALPAAVVACVGGGSNAIGTFSPFCGDPQVALHGAEAAGEGLEGDRHAATMVAGSPGVLHGARTMLLQDADGQVASTHSISAGLDYPAVGPEHAHLGRTGRATYHPVTDCEAMDALILLSRMEGILPAIESAHAVALGMRLAADSAPGDSVLVTVSGRGDKDLATIADHISAESADRP